jgi:hypothetical protein
MAACKFDQASVAGQRARLTPTLAFAPSTSPFRAHRRGSRGGPDCLDAGGPAEVALIVERPGGLEPPTCALGVRRSRPLSYGRECAGAPGRTRTPDMRGRSSPLYSS